MNLFDVNPRHGRARPTVALLSAALAAALAGPAAAQFTTIPTIPGYGLTRPPDYVGSRIADQAVRPTAISANGGVIVGTHAFSEYNVRYVRDYWYVRVYDVIQLGSQAFRWNGAASDGLGHLPPTCATSCPPLWLFSEATGVSADGRIVVGNSWVTERLQGVINPWPLNEVVHAFIWSAADGLRQIPLPPGYVRAYRVAVSGDGRTVVGTAHPTSSSSSSLHNYAFVWTPALGTQLLPGLLGTNSGAFAASFDGSWIAGSSRGDTIMQSIATLWGPDRKPVRLSVATGAPEPFSSWASDISFDGRVVAGTMQQVSGGLTEAFRWTQDTGWTGLGRIGNTSSRATAISGDGRVIVGHSVLGDLFLNTTSPFRWSAATGIQSLDQWLATGGVVLPAGVRLDTATDTNYNGNVVIGTYSLQGSFATFGYLARVGDAGSGFLSDLDGFRGGIAEAALHTQDTAGLLSSMAMSTSQRYGGWSSMTHSDGNGCGWAAASRSRYRNDGPETDAQELGACFDAGPVRLAAGTGRLDVDQHWVLGGGGRFEGRYELLGVALPFGKRMQASITGYKGRFDGSIERRYASGSNVDASIASPNGTFEGVVARVDWTDALRRGRLGISPYMVYAWSRSDIDAYDETGGGFPAAYGASSVDQRELATGVIADFHVSASTSIGLGAETSRRRVDAGNGIDAQVIDLFDASVPGGSADDVDSHALARVRHAIGNSLMLEAQARTALNNEEDDVHVGLQLHVAF